MRLNNSIKSLLYIIAKWYVQDKVKKFRQKLNKRPTWCQFLFYFTSYVLNMFRTLIYPSSGACGCAVELPHRSFLSRFFVCWRFGAAGLEWCPCCRLKLCFSLQHGHHSNPAAPNLCCHNILWLINTNFTKVVWKA